jgi:hypothetical protein
VVQAVTAPEGAEPDGGAAVRSSRPALDGAGTVVARTDRERWRSGWSEAHHLQCRFSTSGARPGWAHFSLQGKAALRRTNEQAPFSPPAACRGGQRFGCLAVGHGLYDEAIGPSGCRDNTGRE